MSSEPSSLNSPVSHVSGNVASPMDQIKDYRTRVGVRLVGRFGREDRAIAQKFTVQADCPMPAAIMPDAPFGERLYMTGITTGINIGGMGMRIKIQGSMVTPSFKELSTSLLGAELNMMLDMYGLLDLRGRVIRVEEPWDDSVAYLGVVFFDLTQEARSCLETAVQRDLEKRLTTFDNQKCAAILEAFGLRGCRSCTLECDVRPEHIRRFDEMLMKQSFPFTSGSTSDMEELAVMRKTREGSSPEKDG